MTLVLNKIKLILYKCQKLYFITNSTAYKEIKKSKIFIESNSCCIFVGEYFDSKSNKIISNFSLPLSTIKVKPYTAKAKIQVLYCDLMQLILCLIFKILKRKNSEIIFTSVMNSRCLYILDLFIKNLRVIDWQYKYVYKYLLKNTKKKRINFKYGDFVYRASHKLNCSIYFPSSINDNFYKLINYNPLGNILILHNPNRNLYFWKTINLFIENEANSNTFFYILIHPKTLKKDKSKFINIFKSNKNFKNIIFSTLPKIIKNENIIEISFCYSLSSSLDFILYRKKIPVASPLLFY